MPDIIYGLSMNIERTNMEKLFGICDIGSTMLSICGFHFQLLTICKQLVCAFFGQAFFQRRPICTRTPCVGLPRQNAHYIHDGEIPLLYFFIPRRSDGLIFK